MPAQALARRTEDEERGLSTLADGQLGRDGGLLGERLARRYGDRITGSFMLAGREGRYAPIPDDVPERLRAALRARGIEQLYSHQAEACAHPGGGPAKCVPGSSQNGYAEGGRETGRCQNSCSEGGRPQGGAG